MNQSRPRPLDLSVRDTSDQRRPFEISAALFPFESKFKEVNGHRVHYIDEGQGPAIVFCHGNPSWSLLYAPIILRLRDRFRCIAVDYPGFGMSELPPKSEYGCLPAEHAQILGVMVDHLLAGGAPFSVFVQDWGGPIGLRMAADRAERIQTLYIGNTWCWAPDLSTGQGKSMQAFSNKMAGARDKILGKNLFVNMSMGQLTHGFQSHSPELVNDLKAAYLAPFPTPESRVGTWVFPREIMESSAWLSQLSVDFEAKLRNKPTLLFWGEQDRVFPAPIREVWERQRLGQRLETVLLPDAAHFFQQDNPDEIVAAMLKHA